MTAAHPVTFEVLAIGARGKVVRNRVRSTDARLAATKSASRASASSPAPRKDQRCL